jgi:cyclase
VTEQPAEIETEAGAEAPTGTLHDVAPGCRAWIAPSARWGWSNAGLVTGRGESLLVDTLYDLRLAAAMLRAMAPATRDAPIGRVVNTHGNGDHWFGNALLSGTEIIATAGTVADMRAIGPDLMVRLLGAPIPGADFARRHFGAFRYDGITPTYPTRIYAGGEELDVGGVCVRLLDFGAAHSLGDTAVHVPDAGVLYTGDLVFAGGTPIVWHGPFETWVRACDRMLDLGADTIVPGHGPVTTPEEIRAVRAYLEYVHPHAERCYRAGMTAEEAARDIPLGPFAHLGEPERLAINVHTVYRELDPGLVPPAGPEIFACLAAFADHLAGHNG